MRKALHARLASCVAGPYERTVWLDAIANDLADNAPVQLVPYGPTQNFLRVEHDGQTSLFALYFARREKGKYFIHAKGRERETAPPAQYSLFEGDPEEEQVTQFAYALLIPLVDEQGNDAFELHLLFGPQPSNSNVWRAGISNTSEPLIIRRPMQQELVPVEDITFEPEAN